MKTISLIKPHFILLAFLLSLSQWTNAQRSPYEAYIDTYKGLAVEQMERYGIPASITLAQGLLESAMSCVTTTPVTKSSVLTARLVNLTKIIPSFWRHAHVMLSFSNTRKATIRRGRMD